MITLQHPTKDAWAFTLILEGVRPLSTKVYKARDSAVKCLKALKVQADAEKWRTAVHPNGNTVVKSGNGVAILEIELEPALATLALNRLGAYLREHPYYMYDGRQISLTKSYDPKRIPGAIR